MKPETKLWHAINDKMRLPGDRLDRIENSVSSGAGDVNGCLAGEDVWIELKAPSEPVRAGTPLMTSNNNHPLLQTQMNWFRRQHNAGGIAFILVRTDRRMMLVDGTKHGDVFNKWTVAQMVTHSIANFAVPTKQEEWRLLRNVIFTSARHRRLSGHASAQHMLDDLERKGLAGDRR
jgi:hypothetical protein